MAVLDGVLAALETDDGGPVAPSFFDDGGPVGKRQRGKELIFNVAERETGTTFNQFVETNSIYTLCKRLNCFTISVKARKGSNIINFLLKGIYNSSFVNC